MRRTGTLPRTGRRRPAQRSVLSTSTILAGKRAGIGSRPGRSPPLTRFTISCLARKSFGYIPVMPNAFLASFITAGVISV